MRPEDDLACRQRKDDEKILMVDDNPTNLQVLQATLEDNGYRLLAARDGAAALAMATQAAPDLVLLDIRMPDMDGYEVCRRLKSDPQTSDIPVIFLSAVEHTQAKVKGLGLGAVDYITKPFQPEEVIARVNTHLALRCHQRQLRKANADLTELNRSLAQKVAEQRRELLRSRDGIVFAMAKMTEARDDHTGKHLERISRYVEILALELAKSDATITPEWIRSVVKTAALHDIGKVAIPDGILFKKGGLSSRERAIMQNHPTIGGDTLLELREELGGGSPYLSRAIEITLGHHEKWDGSGYPFGIKGDAIALSARLVAVADVYDALISKRIYKPGLSHEEAVRFIRERSGTHFDPRVVAAFMACQGKFIAIAAALSANRPH
jgi:putative two-component system response regulator